MLIKWTLALFGLSLLTSQTALDFFATVLVLEIFWLGFRWKQQKSSRIFLNLSGIEYLFLAWFVVVIIGLVLHGFVGDNWLERVLEFRWLIVFYVMITALREFQPNQAWIKYVAIAFFVCSAWAVAIWFMGFDPIHSGENLQVTGSGSLRTGGFLFQPIAFAHMYQIPLCVLLGLLTSLLRWKEKGTWIVAASCLMGVVALVLSSTRGVWISLSAAVLVMTFLTSRRICAALVVAGILIFAGAYKFIPVFHERVRFGIDGGDAERVWIWKANLQMFKEHPIFGIGYGENKGALTSYYQKMGAPADIMGARISHAHNQYIQMLSGTGAIGFLLYMAIVLYFLVLIIRVWRLIGTREVFHQGLALGLIGAQVAFLIGGLTEANFDHSKMRYMMLLVWALTVWLGYEYHLIRERVRK